MFQIVFLQSDVNNHYNKTFNLGASLTYFLPGPETLWFIRQSGCETFLLKLLFITNSPIERKNTLFP